MPKNGGLAGRFFLSGQRGLRRKIFRDAVHDDHHERGLPGSRSGGHMNRKSDSLLGWRAPWRGMTRMATLVDGYRLGRNRFGE